MCSLLKVEAEKMRYLGIDIGSRAVKVVLMDDEKVIDKFKIGTMKFYKEYCVLGEKIHLDLKKLNINNFDIGVSTGYGRNNVNLEKFSAINEIKAHSYGAMFQTKMKDFILLDMGGQDVKVIKIQKALVTDLELNDKCAASCGRYLENMANSLDMDLDSLTSYYENPVELSSTCAVFSESELIGKISQGEPLERLAAGVNFSLYKRLRPMLSKFKAKTIVLSGGVAKGRAIGKFLENDYEYVISLEDVEFNGAIGCCVYGEVLTRKGEI